jgi:cation transporter-like permease
VPADPRQPRPRTSAFPRWGALAAPAGALWGPVLGFLVGTYFGNGLIGALIGAGIGIGVGLALFAAAIVIASSRL